jgi:Zn-dependent protease
MHAYTSHWLGDNTASREGRITLNPLKHIDIFLTIIMPIITLLLFKVPLLAAKPVPFNPSRVKYEEFGAAMVGFAGPLTNIILAALAAGVINTFQGALSIDVLQALGIFMMINIGLFVFNMMPIPPLDGSRVLYAFAPEPLQRFMASLEQIGIFIVFALVLAVPAFSTLLVELNRDILNFLLR